LAKLVVLVIPKIEDPRKKGCIMQLHLRCRHTRSLFVLWAY